MFYIFFLIKISRKITVSHFIMLNMSLIKSGITIINVYLCLNK